MAKYWCRYIVIAAGFTGMFGVTADAQEAAPAQPATVPANGPVVKSLFFSPEDMAALRLALDAYAKLVATQQNPDEGEDFLKQLEGKQEKAAPQEPPKKYYTYQQFFLESLAYHGPEDWIVQANGFRMTPQAPAQTSKPLGKLEVMAIDKDKVSLQWTPAPADMAKITATTKEAHDERVDFDRINGTIRFTVHANQTFSSYGMNVLEGKVQPVVVDNALAGNKIMPAKGVPDNGAAAPLPPAPAPAEATREHSGLSGLIGSYQNLEKDKVP